MQVETLADKASLSGIRKQIRTELNSIGAPAGEAFDCLVAVTEACTNALLHGSGEAGGQPPRVSWSIAPGRARFWVTDFSNRWGAEKADPPARDDEEDPRAGGYGLSLMRKLMDDVDIQFGPTGTTVSLEKVFGT